MGDNDVILKPNMWTWAKILTLDFHGQIVKYLSQELGTKGMWVQYNVGPIIQAWVSNMGLPVGYSKYQLHWPSNGLIQSCYSFQHICPLMGCPRSYLWVESAVLWIPCQSRICEWKYPIYLHTSSSTQIRYHKVRHKVRVVSRNWHNVEFN